MSGFHKSSHYCGDVRTITKHFTHDLWLLCVQEPVHRHLGQVIMSTRT